MELYPAVDIRGSTVSRSPNTPKPLDLAQTYVDQGATWIHVVDLDAVFGTGDNLDLVCEVCGLAGVRVQVGGNLDDVGRIRTVVAAGAERVVLGTAAALDAATLVGLQKAAGTVDTAVAVEMCEGRIFLRDTAETIDQTPEQFVATIVARGVRTIVYRDGYGRGDPDTWREVFSRLAESAGR